MDRILYSIVSEHDWRWSLAASLICLVGVGTSLRLVTYARGIRGGRQRWTMLTAALVGGLAIFSTHFVALQGYEAGEPIRYGIWLTLASFVFGVATFALATVVTLLRASPLHRAAAGALCLAGASIMHFLGVAALSLGHQISWNPELVGLSIAGSLVIAAGASAAHGSAWPRFFATTAVGAVSVLFLHFTAMSAMTLTPGAHAGGPGMTISGSFMLGVVALMVAGVIAITGLVGWLGYLSRSGTLRRIREAIDAMPDGMAFYDTEDRLVLWNQRYAEVNPELSSNLMEGMTFRQIIQIGLDEGLYADAIGNEAEWVAQRLVSRKALSTTMEQHIAGDRWLRVSDRRTAAGGIVTICTDITELKHDARALAEARDAAQAANTAKSQFLANMSHEIRTPLNGVIGVAQALARTELSPTQQEMLDLIHSSGQTLQVLLSDILDLARVESGRLELADEPFDLGRTMREAAQLYEAMAREKGLQFFVDIAPEADAWVMGDAVRIKQILTNLVSNAVKFTGTGFVSLSAAAGPDRNGHPTLRCSIEDSGIGFDSVTRDRLFSRFEQADGAITRKFGGSGLGLAISRQLAEMMGGELDCESEPGGGSAFFLTFPMRPAAATVVEAAPLDAGAADRGVLRVLLADDHPVNRKVVEMILAQIEVEITSVEDGAQALEAFRDADFDLILMDMQMPVMDGLTATREIRLHEVAMGLPRTPVVMLTANALAEHITAAEAAGADRHLAKPFDAAELLHLTVSLPQAAAKALAA